MSKQIVFRLTIVCLMIGLNLGAVPLAQAETAPAAPDEMLVSNSAYPSYVEFVGANAAAPQAVDLAWNTFLGGSEGDAGKGIAVDSSGNIYVAGQTGAWSGNPSWGSPVRAYSAKSDVFVAKLGSDGRLIWNTFLGGSGHDGSYRDNLGIAVDSSGNVYVTSTSDDTWGDPVQSHSGRNDAFVAKLDKNGGLTWNTFLGGSDSDIGVGIAVDGSGNVYVTGTSLVPWGDDPVRPFDDSHRQKMEDAFVAKLDNNGSLTWHTFLGGNKWDDGAAIAVDSGGNVYAAGYSSTSWGSPVRTAPFNYGLAFAAKLDTNGNLTWNTFLGGKQSDYATGIAVDGSGNVYVAGSTTDCSGDPTWGCSPTACTVRPYTADGGGCMGGDAFVAQLDNNGNLTWNTFLGGDDADRGAGIAVDSSGTVHVTGLSSAAWGSPVRAFTGADCESFMMEALGDAFAAQLDKNGNLLENTFLGGSENDKGQGIAVDVKGNAYVVGTTGPCSWEDPDPAWGSPVRAYSASSDAFVALVGLAGPRLALTKSVTPTIANPGETITYTIAFTNTEETVVTNVSITDTVPVSITNTDASSSGDVTIIPVVGSRYVWQVGNPSPGQGGMITITGVLSESLYEYGGYVIANRAEIAATSENGTGVNSAEVEVTVRDADLELSKAASNLTPSSGDQVVYTVTLTNNGPYTATGVVVSDTIPVSITNPVSSTTLGTLTYDTGSRLLVWTVGELGLYSYNYSATLYITGTVQSGLPNFTSITNTAVISSCDQGDSNLDNNRAERLITVVAPELAVEKTVSNDQPEEGGTVTYAITVTNDGAQATGIVVSDTLPADVNHNSHKESQGTVTLDGYTVEWEVGSLAVGISATLQITVDVEMGTAGQTIVNTATITETDQVDPEPSNNVDSASLTVQGADLEVVKTVDDCTPKEGDFITYTIAVTNLGTLGATTIVVSDTLPVSVTWQSGGTYDGGSHAVTWDVGGLTVGGSDTLDIVVELNGAIAGDYIVNTAVISESAPGDPDLDNNEDDVFIIVQDTEVEIAKITSGEGGDLTYTDGQGLNTTVEVSANVVDEDINLIYTPLDEPDSPIPPPFRFANHVFDLTAYSCPGCFSDSGYTFKEPVTITIHYSDADVAGINEEELELLYVTEFGFWACAACEPYVRNPDENWVAIPICHLTEFALVGSSQAAVGGHTEILYETSSLVGWGLWLLAMAVTVTVAVLSFKKRTV